ncbi:MAG: hypothetical protein KDC54_04340, partial [Lewinella sp.]|nr:hypothetical protein [Lewinella sp.]
MQQNQEQGWASPSWGLPDQTNVLDWVTLCGEAALAHQWVEQLLTNGHATSVFDSEHRYSPVLWNMYFAQRQAMRLRGEQVLYFAYPHFLSWQEDEGLQVMPLFRWPVNLEPPRANRQTWEVSIATGAAPRLNPNWLASAAQQYPDTDWETALRQCFTVPEQASARLSELVLSMAEQTQWETATINPAITVFPSAQVMTGQARGGALVWAASLGLWSTEAGLDAGGQHWRVPVSPEQLNPPNAGLDLLDPWQQTALQMAHHNRYLLVKGASGSGKTHLLRHLIGQQLLQKRSVLVVARHLGSLHRVQQQLETFDLAHLSFVAHGAAVEAPLLSGLLAAYDRKPPRYPDYDGNAWRAYVGRMDRTRSRLDEYFRASRRPVFGQYAWSDVLGYYLSAARQESKALLGTQLTTQSFAFRPREYQQIVEAIRQTKPLFDRLASLQHPLQDLNAAIFIHQDRDESYTFIQETTEKLLAQARPLHQRYVRRQSQYADEWTAHSEQQYRNLLNHWQSIDELLATSTEEVGEELLRSSDSTLKLYAVFSGRFRQAIDRRAGLETAYRQLREAHQGGEIFEFQWLEDKQIRRLDSLRDNLRRYRAALDEWRAGLPDRLQ